jgi:hypothetical protein
MKRMKKIHYFFLLIQCFSICVLPVATESTEKREEDASG